MSNRFSISTHNQIQQTAVTFTAKLRRTLLAEGTPHGKALSFSLGTFISLLPTPGLNILLASGLATAFKPLHRGALFAAIGVWNTLVVTPLYGLAYRLGIWWFGEVVAAPHPSWSAQLLIYGKMFLLGNLAIAVLLTLISYLGVRALLGLRKEASAVGNW